MSGSADVDSSADPRARLLRLGPGGRAIDVGCGLGDHACALARIVGANGHVVGLDPSSALLERARDRAHDEGVTVEFVRGDGHALPFDAGTFDAARVERTLQHLAAPARAVAELARVTRPGGVVLASEPDWGTVALTGHPHEPVRVLLAAAEARIRNAWVGRELAELFIDAGLTDVEIRAETLVVRSFSAMRAVIDLPALLADIDGPHHVLELLRRCEADSPTGRVLGALTLFTATGRVA